MNTSQVLMIHIANIGSYFKSACYFGTSSLFILTKIIIVYKFSLFVNSSNFELQLFSLLKIDIFIFAGLKFLIRLCIELGLKEATDYALELKKAEKAKEVRERIGSSRPGILFSNFNSW